MDHKSAKKQRGVPAWVFDALDIDVNGVYRDIVYYFRQFGFMDHATIPGFLDNVLLPNAQLLVHVRKRRSARQKRDTHDADADDAGANLTANADPPDTSVVYACPPTSAPLAGS